MSYDGTAACEYCLFYDRVNDLYGLCRRWVPYTSNNDEHPYTGERFGHITAFRGHWPMVCQVEWCGEFKPHPSARDELPPEPSPLEPDA